MTRKLLCLASCFGLLACQPETNTALQAASAASHPQPTPKPSQTPPNQHTIKAVLEWETLQEQPIRAPEHGMLEHILVQEGQQVVAGQMLAQFKSRPSPRDSTISRSHVDQAAKERAYQKWQQDKKLQAQGFVSPAAVANSEAAYRQAAQARTTTIRTPAAPTPAQTTWLQAPFNGVIKPFTVSTGKSVQNGQQLFTITPTDSKRLKLVVAQDNQQALAVGQRVHIVGQHTDVWLQISELPTGDHKHYMVAYTIWPPDLPKPNSNTLQADIVLAPIPSSP